MVRKKPRRNSEAVKAARALKRKLAKQRQKEYLEARALRTPKWADLEAMEAIYVACRAKTRKTRKRHEVDHIIPLRGKTVSGLHVENNLQILTKVANRKKTNKYDC